MDNYLMDNIVRWMAIVLGLLLLGALVFALFKNEEDQEKCENNCYPQHLLSATRIYDRSSNKANTVCICAADNESKMEIKLIK